jgi:hypothetical protein
MGPNRGEKSQIANGAIARWKGEEEEERERGLGPLGGPVMLKELVWLSCAISEGVTHVAQLGPCGRECDSVETSRASAHGVNPS